MITHIKRMFVYVVLILCFVALIPINTYADNSTFMFQEDVEIELQTFEFLITPVKDGGCGLTIEAACAVMGCIEHESAWREEATNPFDGGFGVLQWTFGRKTRLISWCNEYGYDYNSIAGQMMFFRHELYNTYSETNGHSWPVCETLISSNDIEECLKMFFCHMEAGNNVQITDTPYSKHSTATTRSLYNIRLDDATKFYADYISSQN